MTNEQLVTRIKAGENVGDNMALLYEQVKAFIHSAAWHYQAYEEMEDLEQEGYLALYDAIDGYEPDRGYKFLTYAAHWIRQRMQRYIDNNACCLRLPVHVKGRLQEYKRLCDAFLKREGRKPTDGEISRLMGLGGDQSTS